MNPRKAWLRSQVSTLAIGQLVDGSISLVKDYGVFVDIGNGFHALLHISNISQGEIEHPSTIFSEGNLVKAIVVSIDRHKGRVLVSTSDLEAVPGDMMRRS